MAEAFLDSLLEVKQGDLASEYQECCICLEEIEVKPQKLGISERPVRLPCKHIIHTVCIAKWLSSGPGRNNCPMCRHTLFAITKTPTTTETALAATRRELQLFYGTNQLLQRGVNGESDLYDEGQNFVEHLNPVDWQMNNRDQYFQRRMMLPNPSGQPSTTRAARTRSHRNKVEPRTYHHLLRRHPHMPVLAGTELGPSHVDAMYTMLFAMGVFDEIWGLQTAQNMQSPSRREMVMLIRDSGYGYQWRQGRSDNGFRRCGWRLPGRLRDPSSLSANARALLERQPLPDQEALRAARQEDTHPDPALVGRVGINPQPSHARRMLQWYRRHWWRGFAIN